MAEIEFLSFVLSLFTHRRMMLLFTKIGEIDTHHTSLENVRLCV